MDAPRVSAAAIKSNESQCPLITLKRHDPRANPFFLCHQCTNHCRCDTVARSFLLGEQVIFPLVKRILFTGNGISRVQRKRGSDVNPSSRIPQYAWGNADRSASALQQR